ncbi:MAG: response regulator transcription factor [Actinomycetota bacterium]|nr:response regulator transcription factor [Actinomycetota bacterium]
MSIRLLIAEDNYLVREGMLRLIENHPELELAGVCEDLASLMDAVGDSNADVVLTDIRMPPDFSDEGIQAAASLRESHPHIGVVVISQYDEPEYALALLEKGSQGRAYLLKERLSDLDHLVNVIRDVANGGSWIDPQVVESLVAARLRAERSPLDALTPREHEVLKEMAQGKTNAAIASSLTLTERAIEKHSNSIFSKLGLSSEKQVHRRVKAVLLLLSERG